MFCLDIVLELSWLNWFLLDDLETCPLRIFIPQKGAKSLVIVAEVPKNFPCRIDMISKTKYTESQFNLHYLKEDGINNHKMRKENIALQQIIITEKPIRQLSVDEMRKCIHYTIRFTVK